MPSSSPPHAIKQKMKQGKMNQANNSLFLPEEIINNILKRLPVKSLLRFQCVCKPWKTLIKTQSFIHEHLHHSTIQNPCLLFTHLPFPPDSSLQLFLFNNDMKVVELPLTNVFGRPHVIGSTNGLLCFQYKDNLSHPFLLCNPAIRDVTLVPNPIFNSFHFDPYWVGFGYTSIVDDYNILIIDSHLISDRRILFARVYSLKTGLWKEVESSPLKGVTYISNQSLSVNGNIYCVGNKNDDVYVNTIYHVLISYDLELGVFTVRPSPISLAKVFDSRLTHLTIHEDKVAIFSHNSIGNPVRCLIDMWVMEDGIRQIGERCTWTKKFSVSYQSLSVALATWRNKMVYFSYYTHAAQGEELRRNSIGMIDLTTSEVNMYDNFIYRILDPFLNYYAESLVPVSKNHIE